MYLFNFAKFTTIQTLVRYSIATQQMLVLYSYFQFPSPIKGTESNWGTDAKVMLQLKLHIPVSICINQYYKCSYATEYMEH